MRRAIYFALIVNLATLSGLGLAEEPISLANVVAPKPNSADESIAHEFSVDKAARFLDSASLQWQKQRKCFTCHTNFAYLYARGYQEDESVAHAEVREFADQLVNKRWKEKGPRWDAEVVAAAAALSFNDRMTSGKLHETTRIALDRMWTLQRADGGWDWLKCDWPPMEIDDHYGATLAAVAVGVAPDNYRDTTAANDGMGLLRDYLQKNPPQYLHHSAMLLWANALHKDLMSPEEQQECIDRLVKLQHADGGWCFATLGDWKREDGTSQDVESSDGYGTGFVVFVLRQAGMAADDPRIRRGVEWLKKNQRESGRWFTRSLYNDKHHFISHAGTAFAFMALGECGELKAD